VELKMRAGGEMEKVGADAVAPEVVRRIRASM
jgi:hypothetical protein